MSFLSFLPNLIKGVSSVVEGIGKQRPAGEVISGALKSLVGLPDGPNAADMLTSQKEMDQMKRLPMQAVKQTTMVGGVPQTRIREVPIRVPEKPQEVESFDVEDMEKKLDKLDDRIDDTIGAIKDPAEQDRLEREVEALEDMSEERFADDDRGMLREEIKLKEEFLSGRKKGRRRRRRRR